MVFDLPEMPELLIDTTSEIGRNSKSVLVFDLLEISPSTEEDQSEMPCENPIDDDGEFSDDSIQAEIDGQFSGTETGNPIKIQSPKRLILGAMQQRIPSAAKSRSECETRTDRSEEKHTTSPNSSKRLDCLKSFRIAASVPTNISKQPRPSLDHLLLNACAGSAEIETRPIQKSTAFSEASS